MSHPQSYEILLVPGFTEKAADTSATDAGKDASETGAGKDTSGAGGATDTSGTGTGADETDDTGRGDTVVLRSAVVAATGETGASGYPRYAGEGVVADIDPATRTVEALLVDGAELDYGLSVRINERTADAPGDGADD
ncbi:hypothetical protein ACFYXM_01985 [Streptomyces sp. NPDC002476]|uniref:hypothetical protein n=1 Tax=Streptomyces sp. NPDC002476 TaxID=3364648 RepID=UPI0036C6EA16